MEWDYKISSINRETESTLARVRNRLDNTFTQNQYNNPTINTPKILNNGSVIIPPGPVSQPSYVPLDQSPGAVMVLQDRLEEQGRVIQNLITSVRNLQDEREQHRQVIQDLRSEQHAVMERLAERGVNVETEMKLDQWRRDIASDMHSIQSQLQQHRSRGQDGATLSLTNELYECRKLIRGECEAFRRELDSMKTRMVKMELQMTTAEGDTKEVHRNQTRLERSMKDVIDVHQITSGEITRTRETVSKDQDALIQLRSSYRTLESKLGEMKAQMSDTSSQNSFPRRKKPTKTHNRSLQGYASPTTSDVEFEEITRPRPLDLNTAPRVKPDELARTKSPMSELDFGLTDDSEATTTILPPPREYTTHDDDDSDDYLLTDLNLSDDTSDDGSLLD